MSSHQFSPEKKHHAASQSHPAVSPSQDLQSFALRKRLSAMTKSWQMCHPPWFAAILA